MVCRMARADRAAPVTNSSSMRCAHHWPSPWGACPDGSAGVIEVLIGAALLLAVVWAARRWRHRALIYWERSGSRTGDYQPSARVFMWNHSRRAPILRPGRPNPQHRRQRDVRASRHGGEEGPSRKNAS